MSASTSESHGLGKPKKSISGWKAFDLKQRMIHNKGLVESDNDSEASYPLLTGPIPPRSLFDKNGALEKPFSSVVVASMHFPPLMDAQNTNLQTPLPISNDSAVTAEAFQKLKHLHSWADESLILDVLAGVNNNITEALSLLEAMAISENNIDKPKEVESNGNHFASFDVKSNSFGESNDMSFTTNHTFGDSDKDSKDELPPMQLLRTLNFLPIEPDFEWEEDDVYLIHRKDAIRMIRSASRHSKAANDAYVRGDHASALHFSLKAQENRAAAEKLNAKAAKEILTIRNHKNDPWTLDLHGLHSAEAVEALSKHLQTVESLVRPDYVVGPNGVHKEYGMVDASVQSTSTFIMEKFGRQHSSCRQRPKLLQVITGKGKHSRGAAALPSAIRSFLSENGYHFDETRPGVIMIRPKFRQQ